MADTAVTVIGKNLKLYYSEDYGTPVWVEIEKAINVNLPDISKSINKIMTRESEWQFAVPGNKAIQLTFGYLYEKGTDTVLDDLYDSYLNDTVLTFAVMDGAIATTGSTGWLFPGIVSAMPETQELENNVTIEFTIELARIREAGDLVEPERYEVTGS
jgi:hypothetical protein